MRVAIHTLGSKVNQYESQAMEELGPGDTAWCPLRPRPMSISSTAAP